MKKYVCSFISVSLAMILCLSVLAVDTANMQTGSADHGVYATLQKFGDPETVFSVDLSWGDMEFTYNEETIKRTWDPDTHTYVETVITPANWTCANGADKVTVTNRSNTAITANVSAEINSQYSSVTASVQNGAINLADPSLTPTTTAPSGIATVVLGGDLSPDVSDLTTIGSVTVTIKETGAE